MMRDLRAADEWIARTQARNKLIEAHRALARAQAQFLALGGDLAELELDLEVGEPGMVEQHIPMTAQQLFLSRAHAYATNKEIAAALLMTPGAVRVALHELSQRADGDFVSVPGVFTRPIPKRSGIR